MEMEWNTHSIHIDSSPKDFVIYNITTLSNPLTFLAIVIDRIICTYIQYVFVYFCKSKKYTVSNELNIIHSV